MVEILVLSLGLTLGLELLYAWLWGVETKAFSVIIWMNVLTNPLVVLWHYANPDAGVLVNTILPETLAVVAECLILHFSNRVKKPVALGISINVFSYFAGLVLTILMGWICNSIFSSCPA